MAKIFTPGNLYKGRLGFLMLLKLFYVKPSHPFLDVAFPFPNRPASLILSVVDAADSMGILASDWKQDFIMVNFPINRSMNHSSMNDRGTSVGSSHDYAQQLSLFTASAALETIGPFTLGDSLRLRCMSTRGRPLPNVTWWRDNSILLDSSFQFASLGNNVQADDEVAINDLLINNLERRHNGAILTCRAVNNILAPIATASVRITMHCKYTWDRLPMLCYCGRCAQKEFKATTALGLRV